MSKSKVSAAIRKGVVARILTKRSTAADEAKKYGQKPSTVRNWVREERGEMEKEVKPPANVTTLEPTTRDTTGHHEGVGSEGAKPSNPLPPDLEALARARAAAGLSAPGTKPSPVGPGVEEAARIADEEDRKLVVDTYGSMKKGLISAFAIKVGVSVEDPLLSPACQVSPLQKTILEANAGMLAPMIRGKLQGWIPLIVGTVFDGAVTLLALREVLLVLVKREEEARKAARETAAA